MALQRTTENYLKVIFLLSLESGGGVRSVSVAERLNISKPTVSIVMKRLIRDGFVIKDENHFLYLTNTGKVIAQNTLERHDTIQSLLEKLGVDKDVATQDACEIEHCISPESFSAIKDFIKKS